MLLNIFILGINYGYSMRKIKEVGELGRKAANIGLHLSEKNQVKKNSLPYL